MAISYVNSNYVTKTTGAATWDFTLPTGSQAGDYVLIFNITDNVSVSDDGGCSPLELVAVTANSNRGRMYFKVLDASDITAGKITHTFSTTTTGVGVIVGFRNVTGIYSDSSLLSEIPGTTISTTAIASVPTGSTAVAGFVSLDTVDTVTHSLPTGYTAEVQDRNVTSSPNKTLSVAYKLNVSGSVNPSSTASATVDQQIGFLAILSSDSVNGGMLQFSF